jgi:hypothetical protein
MEVVHASLVKRRDVNGFGVEVKVADVRGYDVPKVVGDASDDG